MENRIHVEEEGLAELKNALQGSGETYKEELARLTILVDEITAGDIQGDLADDLVEKYRAKEADFKAIQEVIDEVEEKVGLKGKDFTSMIETLKNSNRG